MALAKRDEQIELFLNCDVMDNDFFIDIAAKKLNLSKDQIKLRLVLLSPATGKNENFISVLYRANIKIEIIETKEKRSVQVIVKVLLVTMKEMKEFSVFPRERFVYENVLRSFEDIWLERTGEEIQFGPRDVKYETDPYEIIVLDDLKAAGYEMLNRKVGLNMEQTKMLLTKLAKFHAASAIRYQKDGMIKEYFDRKVAMKPMMAEGSPIQNSFKNIYYEFRDGVKSFDGCEVYANKISNWDSEKLFLAFSDIAEPMQCGFQILNHGDTWLNNMMFKLDNETNSAVDVRLIDYQISFWGSPSADLIYFLLTSVEDDIKVDHFDEFVDFYHEQLTASLKALKYDEHIPTLKELKDDLLEKKIFACLCTVFIVCIVKNDSNEVINMEEILNGGDEETVVRIYKDKNYIKALKRWLPFLNERGYLEWN